MSIISREPLRAKVRRILLDRLLSGELEPGSSINEGRLASELGVSRTPLREALINLEFEGFIESRQGKGFSVAPLSEKTAHDLRTLVGILEGVAMQALRALDEDALDAIVQRLERINRELSAESAKPEGPDPERLIQLGNEWHAALVSADDNEQLSELLALVKQRMYRYTYAFLGERERVEGRLEQHDEIIDALRRREIQDAIELVQRHWIRDEAERKWLLASSDEQAQAAGRVRPAEASGETSEEASEGAREAEEPRAAR